MVADRLNKRFRAGKPSNRSVEAGVAVRILDRLGNHEQQWLPNPYDKKRSDRWSLSIINRLRPHTYEGPPGDLLNHPGTVGLVFRPEAVDAVLLCAFPRDGGTLNNGCDPPGVTSACIPGCMVHGAISWCPDDGSRWWGCAFRGSSAVVRQWGPSQLHHAIRIHQEADLYTVYNELIVDVHELVTRLYPSAIEAVFYRKPGGIEARQSANALREAFCNAYSIVSLPLLRFDVDDLEAPFAAVDAPPAPPPIQTPCPLCARLNERWGAGRPTGNWSDAGVLVHVLDGDGITMHGFDGGPPDLNDPLKHAWTSNTAAWKGGDRLSASLINARHPDVFRCLNGCLDAAGEQMRDLPGLVLSPSDSVVRRISCMTWHDAGSLNYNCRPLTTPGCVGGCPREDQWHATRYERWARDELESMMLQQDEFMQWGACRTLRDDCDDASFAAVGGFYNEIIIDKWRDPWEPELQQMIEAVFVAPMASMSSMAYARAVHNAVVERLGFRVPLLFYDASCTDGNPFTLVEP